MTSMITMIVGGVIIAALVGVDIYLAVDKFPDNTWSEVIRIWALATPVVPWVLSVLIGHFFHPINNLKPLISPPGNYIALIWLTAAIGIVGVALARAGHPIPPWTVVIPAIVIGSILWPV